VTSFTQVPIERVQEYWNRRPCNIRHSALPVGTREYFDEVEARKYRVEPHIPGFADFPRWNGKRVLELGCGIGTDTINFARAGARVTACDLSDESIAVARQRAEVMGVADRVEFHQVAGERLTGMLAVEPYDLVYSFGVVHHSPHPERVMQELGHYLAPGGTLKIMVYHRWSWKVFAILLTEGKLRSFDLDGLVARSSEAQTGCPVTYTYSRRTAKELAEQAGVAVTDVRVDHIFPYRIPDYVQYRYVKEWYFRALPPAVFHSLERELGWHVLVDGVKPSA
jgi:2-polyprenyl-3-methyl-5-hydroxy-6-metoxy-1,4-benzoquinol methylase